MTDKPTVTQADRDRALDAGTRIERKLQGIGLMNVHFGATDSGILEQAFAAHREAAIKEAVAHVDFLLDQTDYFINTFYGGDLEAASDEIEKYDAAFTFLTSAKGQQASHTKHPSHVTRISDASSFDEICINCGSTDVAGGGWGALGQPCPSIGAKGQADE